MGTAGWPRAPNLSRGRVESQQWGQISQFPLRSDWKAILVPSGDQAGYSSTSGFVVTCVAAPPETGMTQMSQFPLRSDVKAIWVPSGDQAGPPTDTGSVVICVGVPPLAGITRMSRLPEREETKAICP